jgi:hypothetical protein
MAKSNRSRKRDGEYEPLDLSRLNMGMRRSEVRGGREWTVQPITAAGAQKYYTCPGCSRTIEPGVAHLVAWRNDGIMGEQADLEARRHWHETCWRMS